MQPALLFNPMKSASPIAIEVSGVSFDYETPIKVPLFKGLRLPFHKVVAQKHNALQGIDLSLRSGRITALLGRNGSGKTTLIKVITGARLPKTGNVKIFGLNPNEVRNRIGLCLGGSLIYHRLTARENLEYFGKLYGVQKLDARIDELGEMLSLTKHLDQLVESFSFGMKVKLALARAMIHSPELLILDEPTLGIDIHLAMQLRSFIRTLPCTILLTTHYMEEADALADDVCIIDKGRVRTYGSKIEVLNRYQVQTIPQVFTKLIDAPPVEANA